MTEKIIYSSFEDAARQGLLNLYAEAMDINGKSLAGQSLEELKKLDQVKCKEKLAQLRTEINSLEDIEEAVYDGYKDTSLGS